MNPITQQFMMGAAGAGDTYWMTTVSYSATTLAYNYGGRQFDVNSAGNVLVAGFNTTATLFEMSDKAVLNWTVARSTTANFGFERYNSGMYNADGSIVFGGGCRDQNTGNQNPALASVSSTGTYSTQRVRTGGGYTGQLIQDFAQLSNGNIVFKTYGNDMVALVSSDVSSWGGWAYTYAGSGVISQFYPSSSQVFDIPNASGVNVIGLVYNGSTGDNLLATFLLPNSLGRNQLYYFSGSNVEVPFAMRQTTDGYYFLWGSSSTSKAIYLTYTNSSYAVQWTRYLLQSPNNGAYDDAPRLTVDSTGNAYIVFYSNTGLTQVDIFKYNSSGSIVWKNRISGITVSGSISRLRVIKNALYFAVGTRNIFKIPIDGTKTGTYGPYTYTTSSITDNAGPTLTMSNFYIPSNVTGSSTSAATDFTSTSNTVTTTQYAL